MKKLFKRERKNSVAANLKEADLEEVMRSKTASNTLYYACI